MISFRKNQFLIWPAVSLFFLIHFFYFLHFNYYHLIYQEQTQLFRFNENYFYSFLVKPGGLCAYLGSFFTQFYLLPFAAPLIITLFAITMFFIANKLFQFYKINGILWSFIPVILIAALQSHQLYLLETTIGLLITLLLYVKYISIKRHNYRYLTGFLICSLLYFIAGGFALLLFLLCVIDELLLSTKPSRFIVIMGYVALSFLIPVFASKLVYYIKGEEIWLTLLPFHLKKDMYPFTYALILYFPVILLASKCWFLITKQEFHSEWSWKTLLGGISVVCLLSFCLVKLAYNKKTDILLRIDHLVQNGEWNRALEYSFRYPGSNKLVLYYGNMAMFKTGMLGDKMFHLPQAGIHGLWLEWKRNEVAPFFGGEVFFQLGYISEAYRWAFEALVAKGENPRSLKRLVVTSIILGDTSLARHYINILSETLFYKKWAQHYQYLINYPDLLMQDDEIMEKKHFEMHTDIFADSKNNDIGLVQLLQDHPDNKMAFEYYMAGLLLEKDIDTFAANIYRMKGLGYSIIPAHYEEAMLVYMNRRKKNIVPDGYTISRKTLERFSGYLKIFNSSRGDKHLAAQSLYNMYGGTYWFYLNFVNLSN